MNTVEDYIEAYGACKTEGCPNGTPSESAETCGNCNLMMNREIRASLTEGENQ